MSYIIIIWFISVAVIITFKKWSYKEENFMDIGSKNVIAEENYVFGMLTMLPIANTILALFIILAVISERVRR